MIVYTIVFSKQAEKFLPTLEQMYKERLRVTFDQLRKDPFTYKKIQGGIHLYRIRIGTYRIIYEIDQNNRRIHVLRVERRSKVYQ